MPRGALGLCSGSQKGRKPQGLSLSVAPASQACPWWLQLRVAEVQAKSGSLCGVRPLQVGVLWPFCLPPPTGCAGSGVRSTANQAAWEGPSGRPEGLGLESCAVRRLCCLRWDFFPLWQPPPPPTACSRGSLLFEQGAWGVFVLHPALWSGGCGGGGRAQFLMPPVSCLLL